MIKKIIAIICIMVLVTPTALNYVAVAAENSGTQEPVVESYSSDETVPDSEGAVSESPDEIVSATETVSTNSGVIEPEPVVLEPGTPDGTLGSSVEQEEQSKDAYPTPTWQKYNGYDVVVEADGHMFGEGQPCYMIIDVSEYQNSVDWQAVKNYGVDGVILRATSYKGGSINEDDMFWSHYQGAKSVGLPVGVYVYSYADSPNEALHEANTLLNILNSHGIKPADLQLGVFYDIEDPSQAWMSPSQYEAVARTFFDTMAGAGYTKASIYSGKNYAETHLTTPYLKSKIGWIARYNNVFQYDASASTVPYLGWQYTSTATIPGIPGPVDVNAFYAKDTQNTSGQPTGKDPSAPTISYSSNNKNVGWLPTVTEPNTAGTSGRNLPLYQIKIDLKNCPNSAKLSGSIYENGKWINYSDIQDGQVIGASGVPIQVVNFNLENVPGYRLEYRVHSAGLGWQPWVSEGINSGKAGHNIEAIEFRLVADSSIVVNGPQLYSRGHVSTVGWQSYVPNGIMIGTTGENLALEGFNIGIDNVSDYTINAEVYLEHDGWVTYNDIQPDTVVGSTGRNQEMQAISLELNDVPGYQMEYRAHFSNVGWTEWTDENVVLGTPKGNKIEALEIRIIPEVPITSVTLNKTSHSMVPGAVEKLTATVAPSNTSDSKTITWSSSNTNVATVDSAGKVTAKSPGATTITATTVNNKQATCTVNVVSAPTPNVEYSAHVQNIGWQSFVKNSNVSGTTGKNLHMEATKIKLSNNEFDGGIEYQAHVRNLGWVPVASDGNVGGTTGKALPIEAICIDLYGEVANYYDVYYRVHAQNIGWMPWVKNGEVAGTTGQARHLEAIQIQLVPKGAPAPK